MLTHLQGALSRACLLAVVALAITAAGAPAQASPSFVTTIERDTCVAGAGKYHLGQGVLRVRLIEYGKSGANRFTFVAQVWHLAIHGSKWTMEHEWPLGVYEFENDSSSHYNSRQYAYAPDHNAYHKIVVRVRAWHNDTVLYNKLIQGKVC